MTIIMILNFSLAQKGHELEEQKIKEGTIPKKSLKITTHGANDLIRVLKDLIKNSKINIGIDGKEAVNLYSIEYTIENTGDAPILKNDFSERLKVIFPDRWKILVARNTFSTPSEFNPIWEKTEEHEISLIPLLINPGDKFDLEVFFNDKKNEELDYFKTQKAVKANWSVRIPNLHKIDIDDPSRSKNKVKSKDKIDRWYLVKTAFTGYDGAETLWTAGFLILPNMWGVYAILALAAILIAVYLNFFITFKMIEKLSNWKKITTIVLISLFSFTVSESFLNIVIMIGKNVAHINYFFVILYILSIFILIKFKKPYVE